MKPSKLLERFYRKVYIAVVVMHSTTDVCVETRKRGNTLRKSLHTFDTTTLDDEVADYIAAAASQSPLHYVAVLNTLPSQGAVPTCSAQQFPRYTDATSCQTRCFDESWSVYASDESLYQIREFYESAGLDFIFSPFSLLRSYFAAPIEAEPALYLLLGETFVATAVFKKKRLLFGDYDVLANEYESDLVVELDADEPAWETTDRESSGKRDAQRYYTLVMQALKSFYNDGRYEKVFIERVLIADACGVGEALEKMLEEELFVAVERFELNLAEEVSALAVAEVEDEG
jgi:hypothetical protein